MMGMYLGLVTGKPLPNDPLRPQKSNSRDLGRILWFESFEMDKPPVVFTKEAILDSDGEKAIGVIFSQKCIVLETAVLGGSFHPQIAKPFG